MKFLVAVVCAVLGSVPVVSCGKSGDSGKPAAQRAVQSESPVDAPKFPPVDPGNVTPVKTVENLLGRFDQLVNKRVSLEAQVKDVLDSRSLMVKSGGFFANKIVLVSLTEFPVGQWKEFSRGTKIRVSGVARRGPLEMLRASLPDWNMFYMLRPDLMAGPGKWLIADEIHVLSGSVDWPTDCVPETCGEASVGGRQ